MKIEASAFQTLASHSESNTQTDQSRLNVWVGNRRPAQSEVADSAASNSPKVSISWAALNAAQQFAATDTGSSPSTGQSTNSNDLEKDPKLRLIRMMVEMLTGRSVSTVTAADLAPAAGTAVPSTVAPRTPAAPVPGAPPSAGFGVEFDSTTSYQETEQTRFQAQGIVRTADGKEISVNISLQMNRSYSEENHASLRLGDAVKRDPLVINFNGSAAELQSQRFTFDLNGDGTAENVPLLGQNSGYLALDLNHNGRIDSGNELFGPATGQGFQELARYDQDGNGWIDEGDAVFQQLQVWTPEAQGAGQLNSLESHDVGALYLGATATPFELKDSSNRSLGQVRSTGIYLTESGGSGSLQQIDLTA